MCLKSGMLPTRSTHIIASHPCHVLTVENQGIGMLIAEPHIEAFNCLEEAHADQWVKQGEEVAWLTLRMKMAQNLLWETKQEYIEEW